MKQLNPYKASILYILAFYSTFVYATSTNTVVTLFQPPIPSGKPQVGNCWTSSIAATRDGAWRCMIGNSIHDPCFASSQTNIVVCDADPTRQQAGFALQLNQPLPQPTPENAQPNAVWLLKLADGSTCRPFTGTLSAIHNQPIVYGCSDSLPCSANGDCKQLTGLIGYPRSGKIWRVQKVTYSVIGGKTIVKQNKTTNVSNVWR